MHPMSWKFIISSGKQRGISTLKKTNVEASIIWSLVPSWFTQKQKVVVKRSFYLFWQSHPLAYWQLNFKHSSESTLESLLALNLTNDFSSEQRKSCLSLCLWGRPLAWILMLVSNIMLEIMQHYTDRQVWPWKFKEFSRNTSGNLWHRRDSI